MTAPLFQTTDTSGDSAGTIHADRMIWAMRLSTEALLKYDPDDECAFLRKYHPNTELHRAVSGYVAHSKGIGLSPEKALVAVKQSIAQFERTPRLFDTRRLIECVIVLCIEEYYRE